MPLFYIHITRNSIVCISKVSSSIGLNEHVWRRKLRVQFTSCEKFGKLLDLFVILLLCI